MRNKHNGKIFMILVNFALLIVITACCAPEPQTEQSRWEAQAANIEIIRDDFGVPH